MSEDICPNFACYGDVNARTPRIDEFAKDNIRFTYCSSAAPVCSAARTSLNLGMYGSCAGVGQHRSYAKLPDYVKNVGEYMKDAGYYTGISKTDFNFIHTLEDGYSYTPKQITTDNTQFADDFETIINSSTKPLFFMHTTMCTHQSQYGVPKNAEEHRKTMPRLEKEFYQNRDEIKVPDYHFDSEEAREIWAQYSEKISTLDKMFGEVIETLKKAGKYENSIIFFVGDNGHGIPQGKCELWDEGVRVPFILHLPKEMENEFKVNEDEYGKYCNSLVSFIDFAPTVINLAGAKVPEHMQGRILFGENKADELEEIYAFSERVDEVFENSRCIREKDMFFTCDFGNSLVRRPNIYQNITSPWFMRSMIEIGYEKNIPETDRRAFFRSMPRINEQMFNIKKDSGQFENLVNDAEYSEELIRMREKLLANIKKYNDGVFMPEPLCHEYIAKTGLTGYEIIRNCELYPLDNLINLWRDCVTGEVITEINGISDCEKVMQIKFAANANNLSIIEPLLSDESETVRAYAAFRLKRADVLNEICKTTSNYVLIMYILDLIAVWRDGTGIPCLETAIDRVWVKDEFDVDERYISPMTTGMCMLCVRFDYHGADELLLSEKWNAKGKAMAEHVVSSLRK